MKKIIIDLKKYTEFSLVSAVSQLRAEVANSYLNWLWWIVEPMCFMLLYVFIFGYVFKASEPFFPLFIFSGITIWDFFSRMMNVSVKLIRNNKAIVSKVYIPKYVLLMTKVWVNGFKMLIAIVLIALMMILYRVPVTMCIFTVPITLCTLVLFSFGVGTILLHFGVFLDDLSNVVTIVLRVLFYMTGVFYSISGRIGAPYGEILARINPIAFFLETVRNALLYGKMPEWKILGFWFATSLCITYIGIQTIYKNENSYVKVL